jgi:hypothetical protein
MEQVRLEAVAAEWRAIVLGLAPEVIVFALFVGLERPIK